jgi:CDP-diacylglycerol--glycerol-3-phosphate 3-phosphatidyltransferase/CDP-diacylglycerol--inositol 3-phosphatidyltransferase
VLVIAFFSDVLNLPWLLEGILWVLAVASTITVIQRSVSVRRQVAALPPTASPPAAG